MELLQRLTAVDVSGAEEMIHHIRIFALYVLNTPPHTYDPSHRTDLSDNPKLSKLCDTTRDLVELVQFQLQHVRFQVLPLLSSSVSIPLTLPFDSTRSGTWFVGSCPRTVSWRVDRRRRRCSLCRWARPCALACGWMRIGGARIGHRGYEHSIRYVLVCVCILCLSSFCVVWNSCILFLTDMKTSRILLPPCRMMFRRVLALYSLGMKFFEFDIPG